MTPLEYYKQLRLQEARRLMLAEGVTASMAGLAVGAQKGTEPLAQKNSQLFCAF